VLQSDLFESLAGRRFDVVLFNPPFVKGVPKDDADRAWRSVDVAERFAAQLERHLKPGGFALVLLSTFGAASHFLQELSARGFALAVFAERKFFNEKLTIYKVTHD